MLEEKLDLPQIKSEKEPRIYKPLKVDLLALYGKIDVYAAKKEFASGKCCMCCK